MAILVADCPRCGAQKISFDVPKAIQTQIQGDWKKWFEAFCICRHCNRATIFGLSYKYGSRYEIADHKGITNVDGALNDYVNIEGYVNLKDMATVQPPDYLPEHIHRVFREGATCLAVGCDNAAGTMFRLCIDLVTRGMLPEEDPDLKGKTRRDLGLRLPWLFEHGLLPKDLQELSTCVREDGNDGAHQGTLTKEDAEDLLDFTKALLERIYTEPTRLKIAKERREKRRGGKSD